MTTQRQKINEALNIAFNYSGEDTAQLWIIDQMVRVLLGDSEKYTKWVKEYNQGEDGPDWDTGGAR